MYKVYENNRYKLVSKLIILFSSVLLLVFNAYIFSYLQVSFNDQSIYDSNSYLINITKLQLIILTVFLSPLIETLFFFTLIIEIVIGWNSRLNNKLILSTILVSSTLFAITHSFSIFYFIQAIISAMIFSSIYFLMRLNYNHLALFSTCFVILIHSLTNTLIYIANENLFMNACNLK